MLKVPLETYNTSAPSAATIDLDDERGRVRLTIELDPAEFLGRIPDFEEPAVAEVLGIAVDDERARRIARLEDEGRVLRDQVEALRTYSAELHRRLVKVKETDEITRDLLPDEARSLAAALHHYANEVDSWGRRP